MERVAPMFYGHYYLATPPSVYSELSYPPLGYSAPLTEYPYAAVEPSHSPPGLHSNRDLAAQSDWPRTSVFECYEELQPPFDMDTLKAAIQAAKPDCGEVRRAIESSTFKPRERAFTRLINMCGRQKESRKALEVFATMRDCRGVRPNTYTYSALISACSNAGDWDLAVDVYQRMKAAAESDPGCRPNQVTYNAIIAASERGGRYDVCLACYHDMVQSNALPDCVTYCSAINACQKLGYWEEAERIFSVMHAHKFVASIGVYSTMIDHYATHSSWKAALDLFLTMQMLGQTVDSRCCHGLMLALEAGQQADMAFQLVQAMWANDIHIETTIYVAAMRILAPAGLWKESLEIVDKLQERGNKIPLEAISLLIQSMKSAGKTNLAREVEGIVRQSGVGLDSE